MKKPIATPAPKLALLPPLLALLLVAGGCRQVSAPDGDGAAGSSADSGASGPDAPGAGGASQSALRLDEAPAAPPSGTPSAEPRKSIIREDVELARPIDPLPEPLDLIVPYPRRGWSPDNAAIAQIRSVIESPAYREGGRITIRGHSDSTGSDADNLVMSRRRATAARDVLVKAGVPADRITVIAMGEGRPIAPNRKLDGTPDAEGQHKNRRVEIHVGLPGSSAQAPATAPSRKPAA